MVNEEQRAPEAEEATEQVGTSDAARRPARAAPARKPGLLARVSETASNRLSKLRPPTLDWRTFSYGLLALIGIILIARNWAPVRIDLFGWHPDMPKAIAFIFFFLLGVATAWLWVVRAERARAAAAEAAEPGPEPEYTDETEEEVT